MRRRKILSAVRHGRDESEPLPFIRALDAALLARAAPDSGIHTGLIDLDRMIRPLRAGELVVIAGRSSSGPTSSGMNVETSDSPSMHPRIVFPLSMMSAMFISTVDAPSPTTASVPRARSDVTA